MTSPTRECSFEELPGGARFLGPDGVLYMKLGPGTILPVNFSADGCIIGRMGTTQPWLPEWGDYFRFQAIQAEETRSLVEAHTLRWFRRRKRPIVVRLLLALLIAGAICYCFF
jgi:hypothetical protein